MFSTTDCQYHIIMVIKIILAVIVYFIRHLFTQQSPVLFTLMYYCCYPFTHTSLVFSFSLTVSTISAGCARWTLHLPASLAATCVVVVQLLSHVRLCNPWTIAHQAPLSMRFYRQESWSELPFPSLGDLPYSGIKSVSPALAGRFFTSWATRETCRILPDCRFKKWSIMA